MPPPFTPTNAFVRDVSMRDGIQNIDQILPTSLKVELIEGLAVAGIRRIEATSFMNPKAVPNTADAEEIMQRIERRVGVRYEALVANLRGAERALEAGCDGIQQVISLTDIHNRANVNRSVKQSLDQMRRISSRVHQEGIPFSGAISLATGCPYTGRVPEKDVYTMAENYVSLGVDEIFLCDSMGMGDPASMGRLVSGLLNRWPEMDFVIHIHNTRGMGLANAVASLQAGAKVLDASLGGLGGCPFAPGASGNISAEDLVHMFSLMGVETGVDLNALIALAKKLSDALEFPLHSAIFRAGKSFTTYPTPPGLLAAVGARTKQDIDDLAERV